MNNDVQLSTERPPRFPVCAEDMDPYSGDPHFMLSLARGLLVLQVFAVVGPKVTVADVSRATGLPRAAVRRCLYTLRQIGYVRAEGTAFILEARLLPLASAYLHYGQLSAV